VSRPAVPADLAHTTPVPLPDRHDLVTELVTDADHLADLLGQPPVRTPGASGVLNPGTVPVIRVWDPRVDISALLGELTTLPIPPDILVLNGIDLDVLHASGWRSQEDVVCVRHNLPISLDQVTPPGYTIRRLDRADLPEVRSLLDDSFDVDDSDEQLPDQVLDVPGLRLLAAVDRAGRLAATVGTRPSRAGALLFSLATGPQHQGRGLAAHLVVTARQSTAQQGASHLSADISPDLLPFYQRLGFRPHSQWRRYTRERNART
jgi:ribosomal-protein-alanine N-acetyltransferase